MSVETVKLSVMKTSKYQARTGDVVRNGIDRVAGELGDLHGIRIRLVGHEHRYVVGITTGSEGPQLTDLHIEAAAGVPITPKTLRAIPSRRLAYAAARWASEADGQMFTGPFLGPEAAEMTTEQMDQAITEIRAEADARPGASTRRPRYDDDHYREVAQRVRAAVRSGHPVRETVAAQMHCSVPALDRWIRTTKDKGFLGEDELPRRQSSL